MMRRYSLLVVVLCTVLTTTAMGRKRGDIASSTNGFSTVSDCPLTSSGLSGSTPLAARLDGHSTNPDSNSPTCLDSSQTPIDIVYPDKRLTVSGSNYTININPILWMNDGFAEKTILEIQFIAPSNYTLESMALQGNLDLTGFGSGYIACVQDSINLGNGHATPQFSYCRKTPLITIPRAAPPFDGADYQYDESDLVVNQPDIIPYADANHSTTVIDFSDFHGDPGGNSRIYIALRGVINSADISAMLDQIYSALGFSNTPTLNNLQLSDSTVNVTVLDGNGQRSTAGGLGLTYPPCSGTPCAAPINDSVDTPTVISPSKFSSGLYLDNSEVTAATTDARDPQLSGTSTLGNPSCYDGDTNAFDPDDTATSTRTVWYTFSSQAAGSVTLSTEGSRFDTRLAVFDGKPGSASTALACSDDTIVDQQQNLVEPQATLTFTTSGTVANPHQYYVLVSEAPKPKGTALDINGNVVQPITLSPIAPATHAVLVFSLSASVLQGDKGGLTFNPQRVGTASNALSIVVSAGSGSINNIVPSVTGDFTISNNGCSGLTISGASTCTIMVTFAPAGSGLRSGTLSIASSAIIGPLVVSLSGTGYVPQTNLSATSVVFSDQGPNTTSPGKRVSLTNNGDGPLAITNLTASNALAPFANPNTTCGSSLPAGQSCYFDFNFSPSVAGPFNANFVITDDAGAGPGAQQIISLSGNGAGGVFLGPQPSSYQDTFVNALSAPQKISFVNNSAGTISISNVAVIGPFSILSSTCAAPPYSLIVGGSCDYFVVLAPKTAGPANGALNITDSAGSHSVSLVGNGIEIQIALTRPGRTARPSTATAIAVPATIADAPSSDPTASITPPQAAAATTHSSVKLEPATTIPATSPAALPPAAAVTITSVVSTAALTAPIARSAPAHPPIPTVSKMAAPERQTTDDLLFFWVAPVEFFDFDKHASETLQHSHPPSKEADRADTVSDGVPDSMSPPRHVARKHRSSRTAP